MRTPNHNRQAAIAHRVAARWVGKQAFFWDKPKPSEKEIAAKATNYLKGLAAELWGTLKPLGTKGSEYTTLEPRRDLARHTFTVEVPWERYEDLVNLLSFRWRLHVDAHHGDEFTMEKQRVGKGYKQIPAITVEATREADVALVEVTLEALGLFTAAPT